MNSPYVRRVELDDWQARAACARGGHDPELWFAENERQVGQARAICRTRCPVTAECLAAAVDRGEDFGVWGGVCFHAEVLAARRRSANRRREAKKAKEDAA